jgi:hypothetical protein
MEVIVANSAAVVGLLAWFFVVVVLLRTLGLNYPDDSDDL